MNIAMLGSGFIGRFYADSLQGYRSKDKIVTIYSRREESSKKIADDYKVPFHTTTMEDAINRPEVEVVCINSMVCVLTEHQDIYLKTSITVKK